MTSAISADLSAQILAQMNQAQLLAEQANAAQQHAQEQNGTQTNSSLGANV